MLSNSSVGFPSFSTGMRIGKATWSEYLRISDFSCQPLRNSSSSAFRCRITEVPRCGWSTCSSEYSPLPSLSHFTPSLSGASARRVITVTLSATTKAE